MSIKTSFSKSLPSCIKFEIGRSFLILFLSPLLNIGVIELNFQIEGKTPLTKDLQYNKKVG